MKSKFKIIGRKKKAKASKTVQKVEVSHLL